MKTQSFFLTTTILIIMATGTALTNLSDGLVAYYPFNGNANDDSGNGHNGTVYGQIWLLTALEIRIVPIPLMVLLIMLACPMRLPSNCRYSLSRHGFAHQHKFTEP